MTSITNPKISVIITTDEGEFYIDHTSDKDVHIQYDVSKDREPEPNECTLVIWNLGPDSRNKILNPNLQEMPISVSVSPAGSNEMVKIFVGEITRIQHTPTSPGYETMLECSSQKEQHRSKYASSKTYKAGTPISDIIDDFTDAIGLPVDSCDIPRTGILLGTSFTGAAFPLLKRFVFDLGLYAYINDGVLHIEDVYEPNNTAVVEIKKSQLLSLPRPTSRTEAELVEAQTTMEATEAPLAASLRRKRKRKKKRKKITTQDLLNPTSLPTSMAVDLKYDVVDTLVSGFEFEILVNPLIQPDTVVALTCTPTEYPDLFGKRFRVVEVSHSGDHRGGTTILDTVEYEYDGGDLSPADEEFLTP